VFPQRFSQFASLLAAALLPVYAGAQAYPTKPVRLVTSEPGSALDLTGRILAQGLTTSLGQQVIVDNRRNAPDQVAIAPADGYTLLVFGASLWVVPFLQKVAVTQRDFEPITLAVSTPNLLVLHPRLSAKTVQELTALAKAKPATLNYGSSLSGGTPHLAAEMYKAMAGIDLVRIAYKGVAPAMNDLLGGRIDLMFPTVPSGMPHVKGGKLRALAVTSTKPSQLAPGLPTMAESGLPGYEMLAVFGLFAPTKVPAAIINRLHRDTVQYLNQPETVQRFLAAGSEVVASTPQQFAAFIKKDADRLGKLIKDQGIKDE
jgi:tripartite-type tricarboxylate transporter receptor subunit TctC